MKPDWAEIKKDPIYEVFCLGDRQLRNIVIELLRDGTIPLDEFKKCAEIERAKPIIPDEDY